MKDTIICILHQPHSKVRRVGQEINKLGLNYKIIKPCVGQALPDDVHKFCGVVVFGGPMGVYEQNKYTFLKDEVNWIKKVIISNVPIFGICLGAQLIAKSLGADVRPHPKRIHEIGYYPIYPKAGFENLFVKKDIFYAYQWHRDTFAIPKGAELIAEGSKFNNQAFIYKDKTLAVQFHPELQTNTMKKWTKLGIQRNIDGVQSLQKLENLAKKHEVLVRKWLKFQLTNLFIKKQIKF